MGNVLSVLCYFGSRIYVFLEIERRNFNVDELRTIYIAGDFWYNVAEERKPK